MQIIVGSKALLYSGLDIRPKKLFSDTDYWVSFEESTKAKGDVHIIPTEILKLIPTRGISELFATPDAIYTIKRSHARYNIHWEKTISDIITLERAGAKLLPELYIRLVDYWKTVHGNKEFLNLNRSKAEFFNDYVEKKYDHDLLHKIVAINNVPVYTKCLKDNQEVLIDKEKFFKLPKLQQLRMFREEIYVIALERFLIPTDFKINKYLAYNLALKKTITNLTKNWATEFILENIQHYAIIQEFDWIKQFYNFIGKEIIMHPIIEKVKQKAEELNLYNDAIESALFFGKRQTTDPELSEYYKKYPESLDAAKRSYQFYQYLMSLGYKQIEQEGGEKMGSYAHTVISLEGVMFRADYSYSSYDGYYIDDVWDWKEVSAKQKVVTVYE